MIRIVAYFLLVILSSGMSISACQSPSDGSIEYPEPANLVDLEIDDLLNNSEKCLFMGNFDKAFFYIEKVEKLLPWANDEHNHRRLRFMFDKAVIVTCIEGPTDNSYAHFAQFNILLASKNCNNNSDRSQSNLFDKNGHWPILGENDTISTKECLDRVETIEKSLEIACASLKASTGARIAIEATIFLIAKQAKECCTQHGFWKTCIQPVVDSWKKAELLGIPPDPYWD